MYTVIVWIGIVTVIAQPLWSQAPPNPQVEPCSSREMRRKDGTCRYPDYMTDRIPRGLGVELGARTIGAGRQTNSPLTFSHIPQEWRTVPNHSDYSSGNRIVPFDSFTTIGPQFSNFAYTIAPQYTWGRVTVRAGAEYALVWQKAKPGIVLGDFSTYNAINRSGKQERGYGTSLVYYRLKPDNQGSIRPFGEAEVRLSRFVSILGGYVSPRKNDGEYLVERGYDRHNSIEVYDTNPTHVSYDTQSQYVAVRLGLTMIGLKVGVSQTRIEFNSIPPPLELSPFTPHERRMGVFVGMDIRITQTKPSKLLREQSPTGDTEN